MGVGRFFCVALPFILSVGSLVFLLIACLGGVSNRDLFMFRVDARDFEISRSELQDIIDDIGDGDLGDVGDRIENELEEINERSVPVMQIARQEDGSNDNVTAEDLGLDKIYYVSLWGYCSRADGEDRECTEPELDWANERLNTSWIEAVGDISGGRINLPDEVGDALEVFKDVVRWTQIVYIIAFVALALTVIFGIFANCTRIMSCVTFLVAWFAAVAVIAAAGLSTAMSAVVVGIVEGTARFYGVRGGFNTTFLALVWISAALSIGAGFFWLFTICCCAPNHTSRKDRKRSGNDGEKLLPGNTYQPLGSPGQGGFYNSQNASQYGAPRYPSGARSDMAYEPYSHRT